MPIYNKVQSLHSKCVTLSKINGVAIKAANTPAVSTNTILYLITWFMLQISGAYEKHEKTLTIQRRCLFCLTEKRGAWIWLEGRNQTKQQVSSEGGREENLQNELTKQHRMYLVGVGKQDGWCQHEQQNVPNQEV